MASRADLKPTGPILSTGPHDLGGGLWQTTYLAEVNGRLEVVGVDLRAGLDTPDGWVAPKGRPRALTTNDVRALKLPALRAGELERWLATGRQLLEGAGEWADEQVGDLAAAVRRYLPVAERTGEVGGRVVLDAGHFLEVARCYSAAWRRGEKPTAAVRERWGLSQRTAARWVERARNEHGFLAPTEKFEPGGALTKKAVQRTAAQAREAADGPR